jgi:prenyltransferase beta subunit
MKTATTVPPRSHAPRGNAIPDAPRPDFRVTQTSLVCLAIVVLLLPPAPAQAQSPEEKQATIKFLQQLQSPSGGFLTGPEHPKMRRPTVPSLRATNAALRALKYFGGEPRDPKAAARFVASCFDKSSGGFADRPNTGPDTVSSAVGIMAVVEAKLPTEPYADAVVKYLGTHAKGFEEIRLAAAGLEAINKHPPQPEDWLKQIRALQNPDGTFGKGPGAARDTGSAVAAILRLGGKIENPDRVIQVMKDGQLADGAFGKAEVETSDLETTYRVTRSLHMLKVKPADPDRVRAFIAKCRNTDGGYGVAPGLLSSASGTYFAAIILHWLDEK